MKDVNINKFLFGTEDVSTEGMRINQKGDINMFGDASCM